ncbi:MAG: polyprenyl synthetase family protein [Spirochaetes bacterium]|nr:polyprenyl synthetase family protein [Spirochaetota bacterium]
MNFIKEEFERLKIEDNVKKIFNSDPPEFSIEWGMKYITLSPSKRIRPLLLLESNLIFNEIDNDSYILANSLELIHTYSLVHDDLPCMDDDDFRRGMITLHKIKSEAYAVLVGDALLTKAFGLLAKYSKTDKLPAILDVFYAKSGDNGMIRGQILDMDGENRKLSIEEILLINKNKTASLIELAFISGGINGGATQAELDLLQNLGEKVGHIFQIQDDILDILGDQRELGKKVGSDADNNKSSLPLVIGVEKAREVLLDFKAEALALVARLPSNNKFFINLLDFLESRAK